MNEYEKLLAEIAEKATKAGELALSDKEDEVKQSEELLEEIEKLEKKAATVKKALDAKAKAEAEQKAIRDATPTNDPGYQVETLTGGESNDDRPYKSIGLFAQDVANYYKGAGFSPRLRRHWNNTRGVTKAVSGASEGVPADGGILVGEDMVAGLIKPMYETGEILRRCRQLTISSTSNAAVIKGVDETSRATGSRWGGVRGYWLAEADQITSSKPAFRDIRLQLNKLGALVYATDELLADAALLASVINQAVPDELRFLAESAIVNTGTGSGQPEAIIGGDSTVDQAAESGQDADTIVHENIVHMWARLWAPCRRNAVWLINQECEPQLYTMGLAVGTGGTPTFIPPGGLNASPYATLLGRPVIPVEYCQEVGTSGDLILADLTQYLLATKGDIQAAQSIHLRFDYDESVFRFIYRLDGKSAWNSTLTPFEATSSTPLAPFVTLATRS